MRALVLIAVIAALFAAQAWLARRFGLRRLTYTRAFAKGAAFEGETVELVETIRNAKVLPVPWLVAESRMSPYLAFRELGVTGEANAGGDGQGMEGGEGAGGSAGREANPAVGAAIGRSKPDGGDGNSAGRAVRAPSDGVPPAGAELMTYRRGVFFLAPYTRLTRSQPVTLLRRGRYDAGSVALTAGDLFGLAKESRQADASGRRGERKGLFADAPGGMGPMHPRRARFFGPAAFRNVPVIETSGASISVYPRLLSARDLDIPSSRWQGDLIVRRWIAPDPYLVAGIREGRPGDPRRDTHWAATARTGRLQVKVRDHTSAPKLLVVLNVQKDERQWGDLMAYEQGAVEHAISLAATLCLRALGAGLEAGFAANAPLGDAPEPAVLLPARYAGRDTDILEALARLRVLRARTFHTFLDDLARVSGTDILILSQYDSALIRERMAALRMRGNSVALWTGD